MLDLPLTSLIDHRFVNVREIIQYDEILFTPKPWLLPQPAKVLPQGLNEYNPVNLGHNLIIAARIGEIAARWLLPGAPRALALVSQMKTTIPAMIFDILITAVQHLQISLPARNGTNGIDRRETKACRPV